MCRRDRQGIDRVPGENALGLGVDGDRRKLRRLLAEREQTQLHTRRDGRANQCTGPIERGERGRGAEQMCIRDRASTPPTAQPTMISIRPCTPTSATTKDSGLATPREACLLYTSIAGAAAILTAVLFGESFGFGTIINIAGCAVIIDAIQAAHLIPQMHGLVSGIAMLIGGLELLALGPWLYMKSALGSGPRARCV